MKKLILLSIMVFIALVSKANADFNYDGVLVLKDVGTNTPTGEENPRIIDDVLRMHTRLLEIAYHEKLLTSNGTVTTSDTYIIGSSSSNILVSFPDPSTCANGTTTKLFVVKNIGAGTMTLSPLIDGVGSPTVSTNQAMTIFTDGTRWFEVRAKNAGDADTLDGVDGASYARSGLNSDITGLSAVSTLAATDSTLTNATITNGTITNLSVTTGSTSSFYAINGTVENLTSTVGTVTTLFSDTAKVTTLTATNATINSITIDNISSTSGTVTGNLNVGSLSGINYLTTWKSGAVTGTGSIQFVAGPGIAITGTVTDGVGTLTFTGVGTTTAGGFLDTGSQSVLTAGYILDLNGGSIAGITDAQVPNTITLDNISQITTRNFSNMQGSVNLGSQSNYGDFIKWRNNSTSGTGTINLVVSGGATSTTTYDPATGEGTSTISVPLCFGEMWRTTTYDIAANNKWYNLGLDGTSSASSNITFGTSTMTVSVGGTYQVSGHVSFRDCVTGIVRIIKNWGTEVKGTTLFGNTSNVTWITVTIPPTIVALNANDTIGLQVGCDSPTGTPEIDFISSGTLPDPTTTIYATLSLMRIGN